jgi:hypothetical protein
MVSSYGYTNKIEREWNLGMTPLSSHGQSILLIARAGDMPTYPQYGQSDDDYPKNILTLIVKVHSLSTNFFVLYKLICKLQKLFLNNDFFYPLIA